MCRFSSKDVTTVSEWARCVHAFTLDSKCIVSHWETDIISCLSRRQCAVRADGGFKWAKGH